MRVGESDDSTLSRAFFVQVIFEDQNSLIGGES